MAKLRLDRSVLAQFLPNAQAIREFERVFDFTQTTPTSIEEAAAMAATAAAVANQAMALLAEYAELLEQLSTAPEPVPVTMPDEYAPALVFGTLASQNDDAVAITGGAIDGTAIGATAASTVKGTTITATGAFGCNGKPAQTAAVSGGTLAGVIAALVANGILSS